MAMPIVAAFSEGLAAETGPRVVVALAGAVSVSEGRVSMVDMGSSAVVVGGGSGVGVVEVVSEVEVEVRDVLVVVGLVVWGGRVCDVRSPAPKMSFVKLLKADPIGSMMSEYSDWIGAAMLLGSADMRTSSAFVADGASVSVAPPKPVADAGFEPESAPTWPIALSRPSRPSAVFVAPVMFAGSTSSSIVLLSLVEL